MGIKIPSQNLSVSDCIQGFCLNRIQPIEELHSTAYIFTHVVTGARVIHLYNDDPNNLFSIAFRTPVNDSTGVPHILEHSVLCGSKKFPLKDPFQELLKGSLQTFLNALTYPDKTVYPVSSQVEKDFFNLVDVYCDAVFNPLLTENTFFQEGWHFDVEKLSAPVGIKGIVYNEMKGVFSNFSSHVDRKTIASLFPDTTYFHESGGEPEHITDLSYQQFLEFHRQYYHPSNSFIFLYGNIPSEKTLQFIQTNYLSSFTQLPINSTIKLQPLWNSPQNITIEAPAPIEDDGTATIAVSWIFGDTTDPVTTLAGRILSHYLLGTESSPLKRALIDSGLGEDLDDISGFDSELIQTVFVAALRKCKPENASAILNLILDTLYAQVSGGLDAELIEGAIRQVEFSLREITSGHFPYNLRLAERCYRSWIYNGDPCAHLAFQEPLTFIKNKHKEDPSYFTNLIRSKLVENNHRLLSTVIASSEMGKKLEQQTEQHAAKLSSNFDDKTKEKYYQLTKTLLEQQKKSASEEVLATLPKLQKSDLPKYGRDVPAELSDLDGVPLFLHQIFTSGIVYLDIGFDLRVIPQHLLPFLSLYSELITRSGAGNQSYEKTAIRIALATGGVDASIICKTKTATDELLFRSFIHSKSLVPRFKEMLSIISDLLLSPDLKNRKQIRDILLEERNSLHASVISSGHSFAVTYASSFLTPSRFIDETLSGISQLRFLDDLVRRDAIDEVIEAVQQIHSLLINRNTCIISVTADAPSEAKAALKEFLSKLPNRATVPVVYKTTSTLPKHACGIEISSAVNFVAQTWKLAPAKPESSGLLYLMSRYLSTGYLWDKVRVEGGAYGGMAMMSVSHPVFACASYRDPNLKSTLTHFRNGLEEVSKGISQDKIDQSIIGTIGKIDAPQPPHSLGFGETLDRLTGFTKEFRQSLREAVLGANSKELTKAAQSVLNASQSVITVLGGGAALDTAQAQGLTIDREALLPRSDAEESRE